MKTSKQEADYLAVKKHLENNPGTTARAAIAAVAKKHNKSTGSVQMGYYKMLRRNSATTAAPPKKPTTTKKTAVKPKNQSLDLNVIRASLSDALTAIDALEAENKKNREIVAGLRKALLV